MMSMPFDSRGNPDVAGPRQMSPSQITTAREVQDDFNALIAKLSAPTNDEAARLFALARTHLEIASMLAVKAISRS